MGQVTQNLQPHYIDVSTPRSLLCNNSNLSSFEVNLTCSQLLSIGKVSTLASWTTQQTCYVIPTSQVSPSESCIYMANVTAPSVNMDNGDLLCSTRTKASYYSADIYVPKGWFLLCGLQAYIYVPKKATTWMPPPLWCHYRRISNQIRKQSCKTEQSQTTCY